MYVYYCIYMKKGSRQVFTEESIHASYTFLDTRKCLGRTKVYKKGRYVLSRLHINIYV